ncbi:MAG: ribonuclease E activity regulator RraA [Rhodospirillaceae bacterium]|jgi:regulator of ribonuclease activity A|nr:ribonuclease E activity regulator RraA [Rhodospirillaceae bacterium]MBT3911364.1 ribonuclease E activity regulator RraA [Rhodospirillaceae bacterium]MBT5299487.1 ribonuclease E activity regulator RraA [Rhodospirillaceae bacterium]MBT6084692.1 ribonuclease E activity regulator RraA [Rhodospirillaceae bacterium]MBT6607566.1 ribonuclease E activity regulator RraA [Rhodospirillaceae bacterium]
MSEERTIIRTADICDDYEFETRVCELQFNDYAGREDFHGEVVTFSAYESNKGILDVIREGGKGRVLIVDGRGSSRRALCGGNIAAEAQEQGWEGLIFHGAIRDSHEFTELDFGVKSTHVTAMRPFRGEDKGHTNVVLNIGGITIKPGEYCYADRDCVIILDKPVHR